MKELRDQELLKGYLEKFHIPSLFDTRELPFRLYEYAPGEMINIVHPMEQTMKFFVEGVFDHYTLLEDGTPYLIAHCDGFGFMGDLAFCCRQPQNRYQEVIETVRAVELPLESLRRGREQDNRFLRFLLDTMAQRMTQSLYVRVSENSARQALLAHLRWACPDHAITNVGDTAYRLNFSRRQLQRVLRDLTREGVLEKTGKGCYRMVP